MLPPTAYFPGRIRAQAGPLHRQAGDFYCRESIQNEPAFVRCAGRSRGMFFRDPLSHIGYSPAIPAVGGTLYNPRVNQGESWIDHAKCARVF